MSISSKNGEKTNDPPIGVYVKQIEKDITFRIKRWYYLELLTKCKDEITWKHTSKITKDQIGENISCLEFSEVVLAHGNIVSND